MTPLLTADLRHRVELRQPVVVPDGKGGKATSFALVDTVWAEVTALDGRESVMEHVFEGVSVYRVRIRWRSDVGASWQLGYDGVDLNVTAPPSDPDGRREQLLIMASSQGALKP